MKVKDFEDKANIIVRKFTVLAFVLSVVAIVVAVAGCTVLMPVPI